MGCAMGPLTLVRAGASIRAWLEAVGPDATVHLLPEVGHLLPDQSATLLLDFLRDRHEAGSES
jgi:hypothetical protein